MDLTPDFGISKIKVSDALADQTLKDAGLGGGARDKYGVAVIAIKRGKDVTLAPDEDDMIRKGDILVVAAKDDQLERLHLPELGVDPGNT